MRKPGRTFDRRAFLHAAALAASGLPLGAFAQKSAALPRIGLLLSTASNALDVAFVDGLREQGYVEGRTIRIERRSAEGNYARLPAIAAELVREKPQLIAAVVTQASIAAKEATASIPIVMVAVSDPVVAGIVGNLGRPGGNVTGTALQLHASVGKQVELVRELAPRASRIAVLWNPANVIFQQQSLGEALIAASRLRIEAQPVGARTLPELEKTLGSLDADRPDAVLMLTDPLFTANRTRLAELALAQRLPVISGFRLMVEAGMLASYAPDLRVMARRAAIYVRKILNGAKPGDLPVELPAKPELVVNLKTAEALGIEVPSAVRARADEIIR